VAPGPPDWAAGPVQRWYELGALHATAISRADKGLIGGEQKFVRLACTLEVNGQRTKASKISTWQYFLEVLVPKVCPVDKN
jgi:hypothetical protein